MSEKKLFEATPSKQLEAISKEHLEKVTGSNLGQEVYKTLRDDKIAETKQWMVEVMKKASVKHESLVKACNEAKSIKEDVVQYTGDGKVLPSYTKDAWKKKTEPFEKLEALSTQIDACFSSCSIEQFQKLEKLIK